MREAKNSRHGRLPTSTCGTTEGDASAIELNEEHQPTREIAHQALSFDQNMRRYAARFHTRAAHRTPTSPGMGKRGHVFPEFAV